MDSIQTAKIGVVTVTYNSSNVIDEFMTSMLAQTHLNYVLYIIDNASSDDTLSKISKYNDERIVLIANKDNVGVAAGNNQGIKSSLSSNCTHVLLINNDTAFEPQFTEKLLAGLKAYRCDMVTPKIMHYNQPEVIWSAGGYFDKYRANAGKEIGANQIDKGEYDISIQVDYSSTCCLLICSDVFQSVGLMDEKYFCYFDDTDFCLRARQQQKILYYIFDAKMFHNASSLTGGCNSPFSIKQSARNKVFFIRKHYRSPLKNIWIYLYWIELCLRFFRGADTWEIFIARQKSFRTGFEIEV
jgi:GT2 family glycosyltransferase